MKFVAVESGGPEAAIRGARIRIVTFDHPGG
jgi:hypothetical protein